MGAHIAAPGQQSLQLMIAGKTRSSTLKKIPHELVLFGYYVIIYGE